jgi:hypothetical protein
VDSKSNEIAFFASLPELLNLAERVTTADALHTQRDYAQLMINDQHAHSS